MQLSQGGEYSFHLLFYMIDISVGTTIGIKELAALNPLSETYLSKIFTKLRKAGIARSIQGQFDKILKCRQISCLFSDTIFPLSSVSTLHHY